MAGISLKDVAKRHGDTPVLRGISLDIFDGEFLTLVGPSGCGKSTLLRIIAGLDVQDGGEVAISNRRVDGLRPKERDIAMVFQAYALYPHLSVFDNIALPLRVRRLASMQRLPLLGRLMPGRVRHRARHPPRCRGNGRHPRHCASSRPQAGPAVRWPETARRARPRDGSPSVRVPDGRASVQSRRQAQGADAYRDFRPAPAASDHVRFRDARSGGGDDDVGSRRRHDDRRTGPGRHARRTLSRPTRSARRRIHRQS